MSRILFIEDDPNISEAFQIALERLGHSVSISHLGGEGSSLALTRPGYDLIVLDLMLPDINGLEVCRRIRKLSDVPIIMMTARGDDAEVLIGLEAGADDYVVKPIKPYILEARIRTVLKRSTLPTVRGKVQDIVTAGGLEIDRSALKVTRDQIEISLTPTEFRLILELTDRPGQVYSREQLLRIVWGYDEASASRIVDVAIQRLRGKIEKDPTSPIIITTARGFGYRFDLDR